MDRIRALPVTTATKGKLIVGKGYAMGLYGVEATPLNASALRKLQGRTANALTGKLQSMRCPEAVLATACKSSIELEANIFWQRTRMLRKAWHARPAWRPLILRMLGRVA